MISTALVTFVGVGCGGRANDNPPQKAAAPAEGARVQDRTQADDIATAVKNAKPEVPIESKHGDSSGVRISLRLSEATRDRLNVTLVVENNGEKAVAWDSLSAAFVTWRVTTLDGVDLVAKPIEEGKAGVNSDGERFVMIQPGRSLSKVIGLTDTIVVLSHARKGLVSPDGGFSGVVPVGWEDRVRFEIPEELKAVRVYAEYNEDDSDASDGFAVYYGKLPDELPMPRGIGRTNELIVELDGTQE